jgi:hypothetical protein
VTKRSMTDRALFGEDLANDTRTSHTADPLRAIPPSTPITPPAADRDDPAACTDPERERRLRRARFLADLAEARELRKRVAPRRAKSAEMHARLFRTFRY